jgi:glycosidase
MDYDISNYNISHEKFGNMYDMDELIKEIPFSDMKLILDLGITHISSELA